MGGPKQTRVLAQDRATDSRLTTSPPAPLTLSQGAQRAAGRRAGAAAPSLQILDRNLTNSHWPSAADALAYLHGFVDTFYSKGAGSRLPEVGLNRYHTIEHYKKVIEAARPSVSSLLRSSSLLPGGPDTARERMVADFLSDMERGVVAKPPDPKELEIQRVARSTGMSVEDVRAVFREYDSATARPFPGTIILRSVPFLNTPMARSTKIFGSVLSFILPGAGLIEAYYGVDAVSGRELSNAERGLRAALDLIPLGLVAKGALKGARIALRAGGKLLKSTAASLAKGALHFGLKPGVFLRVLVLAGNLGLRRPKLAKSVYAKLSSGHLQRLTKEELSFVRGLSKAVAPIRKAAAPAARAVGRRLSAATRAALNAAHPAVRKYLERRPKISLAPDSIRELDNLFKSTRRPGGTYQSVRAASSELTVLEKLAKHDPLKEVRLIKATNIKGEFRADFRARLKNGDSFHVEVTAATSARRSQRGPSKISSSGETVRNRVKPPKNKTKTPKASVIRAAFARKITKGQISASNPGVIIVNVVGAKRAGPLLSAKQIAGLTDLIKDKPFIKELLIVANTPQGRKLLRVGSRDSGLGIADGVLRAAY